MEDISVMKTTKGNATVRGTENILSECDDNDETYNCEKLVNDLVRLYL
jgi:hypothetical protein